MQNSKLKEIVFLNGKFLPIKEARLSVFSPGLLYGFGLFETMRSYNNRIVYFAQHLERLKDSCKLLKMSLPYSLIKLKDYIKQTVEINGFKDAYIRLTLWKNIKTADILIMVRRYKPFSNKKYKQGFSCLVSKYRQNEDSLLAQLKTTNYLLYQLAYLEAEEKGFDEAIILNNRGYICEGTRSNLFFVKDNELFTPSLACGCLDGITRKVVFDLAKIYKIKVYEGNFNLQDLCLADEACLTNSLLGIMPLRAVENHLIGKGKSRYTLTHFFIKKYNLLLKNGI